MKTGVRRRGQIALEWVLFTVVAVTVMVSMRSYLVSLVAGRWRQAADQFGYGRQYEPFQTTINGQAYGPCTGGRAGVGSCAP